MIRFLQTPGPTKKIILGGMLLVICAAMVITLVPGGVGSNFGLGGPGKGILAKVAGEDVTLLEVQREARSLVKQQFPRGGAMASQLLPFFATRAAETLISEKALIAEAQRMGLRVTNDELSDDLQHGQLSTYLFPGGNFVGEKGYEDFILSSFDMTVPQFEEKEKNFLLIRKLRSLVTRAATVSDSDVEQEFLRRNTKVKFDYALLTNDEIRKGLHPADAELKAFFERNQAAYNNAIPEKRKVRYVLLEISKVMAQNPLTREDLQAYYNQHQEEFRVPDQVNLRQIVIKKPLAGPDGKTDAKGDEAAKTKAGDVLKQLKAGADFAKLAGKYSDDPSAKNGGLLGWIGRGRIPAANVEKAAFSLPKGAASDVIDGGYAFVILHVDDKQPARVKTLDEVKPQIEPVVAQQKAARAAEVQANVLLSQARTSGLEKAAAAKGLTVTTTDFVSRTDALPGIGFSPEFMGAVFSAQEKSLPDMVRLPQGYAAVELLGVKPPATPAFEEIRARVENDFKSERASMLLGQKTAELSDRARAAHDLKKAARELGAAVKTSEFVGPEGQVPGLGSMTGPAALVFTMQPGSISGPINNNASGAVIHLLEKQEPPAQDLAAKKDQIREGLLQGKRSDLFGLFLANLRQQMEKEGKIKINPDEMKALTAGRGEEGS
jgi:peptidyl-prolyl cis-trans isomerase D